MRVVPTSTPPVALTTTSAPSAACRPAVASPWKSEYPGVSRRLILVSIHSAWAHARLIEKPRPVSSGSKSVSAVPSFTVPCRLDDPDTKASASTSVVLPLAPCPTTAILRMSSLLYSRIRWLCSARGGKVLVPAGTALVLAAGLFRKLALGAWGWQGYCHCRAGSGQKTG